MASNKRRRFAVNASVRVIRPGVNGVVIQADDTPSLLGQYMHIIQTPHGTRKEPGSNIELIPTPQTNARELEQTEMTKPQLLLPEQGIAMLKTQLAKRPEDLRYDDPDAFSWEGVTQKIVDRCFGEHSTNSAHFGSSVSVAPETDEEGQEQHVRHIRNKVSFRQGCVTEG